MAGQKPAHGVTAGGRGRRRHLGPHFESGRGADAARTKDVAGICASISTHSASVGNGSWRGLGFPADGALCFAAFAEEKGKERDDDGVPQVGGSRQCWR